MSLKQRAFDFLQSRSAESFPNQSLSKRLHNDRSEWLFSAPRAPLLKSSICLLLFHLSQQKSIRQQTTRYRSLGSYSTDSLRLVDFPRHKVILVKSAFSYGHEYYPKLKESARKDRPLRLLEIECLASLEEILTHKHLRYTQKETCF